jgi:hypothetical protein
VRKHTQANNVNVDIKFSMRIMLLEYPSSGTLKIERLEVEIILKCLATIKPNEIIKRLPNNIPLVTSDRDDRALQRLQRLVRRMPFATSVVLKQHWLHNRRLSTQW